MPGAERTAPARTSPCDDDLLAFLDGRAAVLHGRWFGEMTPQQARASFDLITAWNRSKVDVAPPVAAVVDRLVTSRRIAVRVYTPSSRPVAALVFLHGGGFVIGSIDSHDEIARFVCERAGVVVVSVEYPLAPEARFPVQIEVGIDVLTWVRSHADSPRTAGLPVLVGGDSAGGTLSAAIAATCRDRKLPLDGHVVVYAPLVEPAYAPAAGTPAWPQRDQSFGPTHASMSYYWTNYTEDGTGRASPLLAPDLRDVAPALVVTAELDTLASEGVAYAARLRDAGVAVRLLQFARINHGFLVHGWLPQGRRSEAAHDAALVTCRAVRDLALRGATTGLEPPSQTAAERD